MSFVIETIYLIFWKESRASLNEDFVIAQAATKGGNNAHVQTAFGCTIKSIYKQVSSPFSWILSASMPGKRKATM